MRPSRHHSRVTVWFHNLHDRHTPWCPDICLVVRFDIQSSWRSCISRAKYHQCYFWTGFTNGYAIFFLNLVPSGKRGPKFPGQLLDVWAAVLLKFSWSPRRLPLWLCCKPFVMWSASQQLPISRPILSSSKYVIERLLICADLLFRRNEVIQYFLIMAKQFRWILLEVYVHLQLGHQKRRLSFGYV